MDRGNRLFLDLIVAGICIGVLIACNRKPEPTPSTTVSPATAQPPSNLPSSLNWTNFSTGANVKTMALERDDLWLGLPNGMIRYDTRTPDTHEIYTPVSTQGGLLSRGIYVIRVDREGNKWIGTYGGGLTRFDGRAFRTYTMADGLGDQWVYDIVFDRHDRMWVATWKGVSVFDGKSFKNYGEADGLADKWVYAIALDQDGIFWFGTEAGVSRFDPSRPGRSAWTTFTHKDGLGANIESSSETVISALPSSEEASSEYGSSAGRHHMDPTKRNIGPNPNFVIAAAVGRDNHKWFGTWGAGLSRFDGKVWKTYTQVEGLGGNHIHVLAMDPEGHLWAGTNGGASWFDGERWHNLSEKDGLLNNNVFSIVFDSKGRRWFGTWKGLSMHQSKLPS